MWIKYCCETEKAGIKDSPVRLFAVKESMQECIGFNQFELVFGHSAKGPLQLLNEKFQSSDVESYYYLFKHVSEFRYLASCTCMESSLIWYDIYCRECKLVQLQSISEELLFIFSYCGPYKSY